MVERWHWRNDGSPWLLADWSGDEGPAYSRQPLRQQKLEMATHADSEQSWSTVAIIRQSDNGENVFTGWTQKSALPSNFYFEFLLEIKPRPIHLSIALFDL